MEQIMCEGRVSLLDAIPKDICLFLKVLAISKLHVFFLGRISEK